MKNAMTVWYTDDNGEACYALVKSHQDNGNLDLVYKAHTGSGWEVHNDCPRGEKGQAGTYHD